MTRRTPGHSSTSSPRAAPEELLAPDLVQPAPDPVLLADRDGEVQARPPNRATLADRLGRSLAPASGVPALAVDRREEGLGLRPATGRLHLPVQCASASHVFSRGRTWNAA